MTLVFCWVQHAYIRLAARESVPDSDGWVMWRPGPLSWIFGFLCLSLAGLFIYLFITEMTGQESDDRLLILFTIPLVFALMLFGIVVIFWTRIKASAQGVAYRGLSGWQYFSWDQVDHIDEYQGSLRLRIYGRRPKYFWPYGYGAEEVCALFYENDKRVLL